MWIPLMWLGFVLLSLALLAAVMNALWRRGRFRADGSAFIAPTRSWQLGSSPFAPIAWFILGLSCVLHSTSPLTRWGGGAACMVLTVVTGLRAISGNTAGCRLMIRPEGIEVRGVFRVRAMTWEALADPFAVFDAGLRGKGIPRRGTKRSGALVYLKALDVPAQQVLAGIHYYRDHPDHRPAIGQWHELQRFYAPETAS